ncbi:siderophore-interacting protein [Niastella sp. OAS944]|uniref:siderophore-interacting protein n=1 Tax=Niastella sp. OAS944 TaxID=2664089 RepID=UPI00349850BB|nr:NADPH-dependent ferric siderophore reductase [Chitinophagaceae bacterium OAS944]
MPKAPKWFNDTVETLLGSKMPRVKVTETEYLNPFIKRIRLQGELNDWHCHAGYATGVRISDTEYRNYTPSFDDVENGIVELIVHLHGDGPGSRYMNNLSIGDELKLIMPRGKKVYSEDVKQYFFFGDETTLAMACALNERAKKNKALLHFYFELDAENKNIPAILGLDNYSVFSKNKTLANVELVNQLPMFQMPGYKEATFIVSGNATSVQTVRRAIKQYGVSGSIIAQAYWAAGKTGL